MLLKELFEHKKQNDFQVLLETLVLSSWIWDIAWDENNQTIRMITKNKKNGKRKTYVLHGLTEEIASRWIQSNSKGKFWHRLFKHIITPGPTNTTPSQSEPEPEQPAEVDTVDTLPVAQPMSKKEAKRKAKRKAQRKARKITRRSSKR